VQHFLTILLTNSDIDDEDYLTVDVYTYKKGSKQFAGSATLFQLQTIQPYDEVIDNWYELKAKPGQKEKDTMKGSHFFRTHSTFPPVY
jgi:hypothetical protein